MIFNWEINIIYTSLPHNGAKHLHDNLFPTKRVCNFKDLEYYNCLSKSSQYTTWALPINEEFRNSRRIMLMWYCTWSHITQQEVVWCQVIHEAWIYERDVHHDKSEIVLGHIIWNLFCNTYHGGVVNIFPNRFSFDSYSIDLSKLICGLWPWFSCCFGFQ